MQKINFQIITKDIEPNSSIDDYKLYLDYLSKVSVLGSSDILQIRIKEASAKTIFELTVYVKSLLIKYAGHKRKPLLFVNDRPDIAFAAGADGAHIGQEDIPLNFAKKAFPHLIFGVSAKNMAQAKEAEINGADFIGIGPIYPTISKDNAGDTIKRKDLELICGSISIPVVGIGGINSANVGGALTAGLNGIAVIGAVSDANDPLAASIDLRRTIDKFSNVN